MKALSEDKFEKLLYGISKWVIRIIIILLTYCFIQPIWFECWYYSKANDNIKSLATDWYGTVKSTLSFLFDTSSAYEYLVICYPYSINQLIEVAEDEYEQDFHLVQILECSRFYTSCIIAPNDNSDLCITISSKISRAYSDGGSWIGFIRYTFDDYQNSTEEISKFVPNQNIYKTPQ